MPPATMPEPEHVNGFTFGSGPARRNVASLAPSGPSGRGDHSGWAQVVCYLSPFYTNQLRLWLVNDYLPLSIGEGVRAGNCR